MSVLIVCAAVFLAVLCAEYYYGKGKLLRLLCLAMGMVFSPFKEAITAAIFTTIIVTIMGSALSYALGAIRAPTLGVDWNSPSSHLQQKLPATRSHDVNFEPNEAHLASILGPHVSTKFAFSVSQMADLASNISIWSPACEGLNITASLCTDIVHVTDASMTAIYQLLSETAVLSRM